MRKVTMALGAVLASLLAAPAAFAQVEVDIEGGISEPLPIAVPVMPTPQVASTPAGATDALGRQLADCTAPSTIPSVSCSSSGTGARNPGSASSGMNGGSRLMMSSERSLAARRRASCSRCEAASRGSSEVSMRYAPSAASVQDAAISA